MMLKVPHDSKCGTPYVDSITSKKARHKKGYIYTEYDQMGGKEH